MANGALSNTTHEKPKRRRIYRESIHQKAYMHWLKRTYPKVFEVTTATNAGGKRTKKQAARAKAEGLAKDFPDLIILYPAKHFHGLMIEFKRDATPSTPKGTLRKSQKEKLAYLKSLGYEVVVSYGWDTARTATINYLSPI